jgi:hypothetical protein
VFDKHVKREVHRALLLTEEERNSSRISVVNPDTGKMQGNPVDGFAEVIRLSENEWTRCDVRLKMLVAQDVLTGEFSSASIIRTSIIRTSTDKKKKVSMYISITGFYIEILYCILPMGW